MTTILNSIEQPAINTIILSPQYRGRIQCHAMACSVAMFLIAASFCTAAPGCELFQAGRTFHGGQVSVLGDFNGDGVADAGGPAVFLGNRDGSFQFVTNLPAAGMARAGDFNGDGHLDFAFGSDDEDDEPDDPPPVSSVSIWFGTGDGTFRLSGDFGVPGRLRDLAAGDFNNDGRSDLALGNPRASLGANVQVLLSNGDGTFRFGSISAVDDGPDSVAVADFNNDGKLDIVGAGDDGPSVSVLLGNGDGTFQPFRAYEVDGEPTHVRVGDLNTDGALDLVADGAAVLLGNGDGTFQEARSTSGGPVTVLSSRGAVIGDVNGDGRPDLVISLGVLLGNGDGTFQPPLPLSSAGGPVAVGEFNGDGRADLLLNSGGGVLVLLGNGDGTFPGPRSFPAGGPSSAVAVGDFNRDGRPDLVSAHQYGHEISVLLGNGDATFQASREFRAGEQPRSVAVGEFNGDGWPDLAVANEGTNVVSVLLGNGDGTFRVAFDYPVGRESWDVVVGDFNRDGRADLAVATIGDGGPGPVAVLLGNGNGTFQPARRFGTERTAFSLTAADFNRDGGLDLAMAEWGSGNVSVLLGIGDGTFQPPSSFPAAFTPLPFNPMRIAAADFNNDHSPDLAVLGRGVVVRLGTGDGGFQDSLLHPESVGLEIAVADFNHDGQPDLAAASMFSQDMSLLTGNGDGTFEPARRYGAGGSPTSLAVADFDRDGQPDLAMGDFSGVTILIGNRCTRSADQQIADLMTSVANSGVPAGTLQSLQASLSAAEAALARGNLTATCNVLGAFIHKVEAQAGKKLTHAQDGQWITAATRIRALLGCR